MWTTFKDYRHALQGKGYTKAFVSSNARATNEFRNRCFLVYAINKFMRPALVNWLGSMGAVVDQDAYALSEMLQWIWRSAIRDGEEIWIYVPSERMRNLLIGWMEQVAAGTGQYIGIEHPETMNDGTFHMHDINEVDTYKRGLRAELPILDDASTSCSAFHEVDSFIGM